MFAVGEEDLKACLHIPAVLAMIPCYLGGVEIVAFVHDIIDNGFSQKIFLDHVGRSFDGEKVYVLAWVKVVYCA